MKIWGCEPPAAVGDWKGFYGFMSDLLLVTVIVTIKCLFFEKTQNRQTNRHSSRERVGHRHHDECQEVTKRYYTILLTMNAIKRPNDRPLLHVTRGDAAM